MSKVEKNRFILLFSAVLAILCSLAVFTARAETRAFTMEDGRVSESLNLVTAEPARAGDNIREASNYGIVFEDGAFLAAATGDWFRAAMRLENRYLDAKTVIMNGEEVPADHATAYISVDLTFTEAAENRTLGTLIGTRENGNATTYYAAVVSFSQKIAFIYTFDVDEAGNYIAGTETQGPASYTPVEIELGTKYGLEVLLSPSLGVTVCWNGATVCENLQTVYETGKPLLPLTPTVGLSWADVTGRAENFVLKYLDAEAAVSEEEPELTLEDARTSESLNLVTAEKAEAGKNIRESSEYGITWANGAFETQQLGNWERSAKVLSNIWLNSEVAVRDGVEIPTSEVTSYFTAQFRYRESAESRTAGILFGKRPIEGGTRYYGLVISPTQKVVFVYSFDLDPNGSFIPDAHRQGPLSYEQKDYEPDTDYAIEILMKPGKGIDVCVGGQVIVTDCASVYETNDSLVGLTPIIGLSWCDISASVSGLGLQYLDAEPKPDAFTMEDARASSGNLVSKDALKVTGNFRETDPYGIVFEDGAFLATATGNWSRSAMQLGNRYLDSDIVSMSGEETSSACATAYISVDLTFTSAAENRNFGTLIGTSENGNTTTYYAVVVSYTQRIVFVYTFDVDRVGHYIAGTEAQGPVSYTPVEIELGTKYSLEVLLSPSLGITVCWGGETVCENLQTVYETGKSLLSLSPAIGLSWADVTGRAENFVLKYLNAEAVPEEAETPVEEPTYPEPGPEPEHNTEIIIPEVEYPKNPNGCGGAAGAECLATLPLLALSFVMIKRRKNS